MAMGIWARKYRYCSTGLWSWRTDAAVHQTFGLAFIVARKKYLGGNMSHIFQTRQRRLLGREFILLHKARSDLFEVEAVGNVIGGHEGSQQMGDGTGLAAVRPERERVHPPLSGEQKTNVCFYF